MDVDVEGDEQLQIDLSCSSKADLKSGTSGAAERHSAMTWLQAAEHVLREESPGMHIRDLTRTILELGMVRGRTLAQSTCVHVQPHVHAVTASSQIHYCAAVLNLNFVCHPGQVQL